MIDFKYHVVSIVAVFLALAVGIVLGTNVLSGDVLKNLKAETTQLRKTSQDLRTQVTQQQSQLTQQQNFAAALEPIAVEGRLRRQRIAVVMLPGASKTVRDQIVKTLTSAGATVTAQVDVTASYVDPTQQSTLDELSQSLAPTTLDLAGDTTVSRRAAAVMASALVVPESAEATQASAAAGNAALTGSAAASDSATGTTAATPAIASPSLAIPALPVPVDPGSVAVLAGLQKAGFVKLDQTPTEFATLAIVVAPTPPDKPAAGATAAATEAVSTTASLDLITALDQSGAGSIVAGAAGSATAGGLLAQLRTDAAVTKSVSSVDDIDTAAGQVALVFAAAVEATGRAGQYGSGIGAQAPLPTPPTPSGASPSPAATPTPAS